MSRTWALSIILILFAVLAHAQQTSGTIGGTVRDASRAAMAGAGIVLRHVDTGVQQSTTSNSNGLWIFPDLPLGEYEITVTQKGFKTSVRSRIVLHLGDHLSFDVIMEIGDLSQQVTVSASAQQLQTENSEQSFLVSGDQVRELQLNGRSFVTLVELIPGVSSDMPDRTDPNTNPALFIGGARSTAGVFNLDGGNNTNYVVGSQAMNTFTSIESVEEFQVLTSNFSAEFGQAGFSQVNLVTKSGSRDFHGSAYEFLRNDAFDAPDAITHQLLPLKLNNFGYTIGGPVLLPGGFNKSRSKTFFFWMQEWNRIGARADAVNTTVPTAALRQGIFPSRITDPTTSAAFPSNTIPASRLDANALKLLSLYPQPNFTGGGSVNYTSALAGHQNWREEVVRIDHNFTPNLRIFGRYVDDSASVLNPYGGSLITQVSTQVPGISTVQASRPGSNLVLALTDVITPTLLNEFRFTLARRLITFTPVSNIDRTALGLTIPEVFPENQGNLPPAVTLGSGYAALAFTKVFRDPFYNLDFSDSVTKNTGRHTIKAGVFYSMGRDSENSTAAATNGAFTFSTAITGNPVANLLLGLPDSYTEASVSQTNRSRWSSFEMFVQDDIRVNSRLSLNLGLRFTNIYSPWDEKNQISNFVPSLYNPAKAPQIVARTGALVAGTGDLLNGMIVGGQNSPFGRAVTADASNLFQPRAGFAYDLFGDHKTALRGGYGVFYTRPLLSAFVQATFNNPPFTQTVTYQNPALSSPSGGVSAPNSPPTVYGMTEHMKAGRVQQWSFGVERDLFGQAILNVSYVGGEGSDLMIPLNINSPAPGSTPSGVNINAVRPYLGYGAINYRGSIGSSFYNSLQVSANRRMSKRLTVGLAYTYAKSMDNSSSDRGTQDTPPDSDNLDREWGRSDFDRTHVLTVNSIVRLPGPARRNTSAAGLLLNGWQLSGIWRKWSGKPFDVLLSQDVAGIGAVQNQRPNVIADTKGPQTHARWFNINAFARPATGTFGNLGRNSIGRPGIDKLDLALFKNFAFRERCRLQFRSEFFNALNHPSFTDVGRTLNTTATGVNPALNNLGVLTTPNDARVLQLALKLVF